MTIHELTRRFPRASAAFLRANCAHVEELPAGQSECPQRDALDPELPRKEKSSTRFTICFECYASRPCDWDNYSIKELQDLLVESGLLPGDKWNQLEGRIRVHKVQSRQEERTVITITPL